MHHNFVVMTKSTTISYQRQLVAFLVIATVVGNVDMCRFSRLCSSKSFLVDTTVLPIPSPSNEIWCLQISEECDQWLQDKPIDILIGGVVQVTIAVVGILLNVVFCYVLSRKEMRSMFNFLLIALAIFDNLFLLSQILESFRDHFKMATQTHIVLFPKILYPFKVIVFCSSIYMVVAISVERYIAVTRPIRLHLRLRNNRKEQIKRFMKYVLPVFIFSVIISLPKFFETKTVSNDETELLSLETTTLRHYPNYIIYYLGTFRLIITVIIPFAVILYLNVVTYTTIRKRRQDRIVVNQQNMNAIRTSDRENDNPIVPRMHSTSMEKEKASEETLSFIFLTISLLFLICHLPRSIFYFHEAIVAKKHLACVLAGYKDFSIWQIQMHYLSGIFLTINSSLNSAIYCLFSSKYQEQMKKSFKFCKNWQ